METSCYTWTSWMSKKNNGIKKLIGHNPNILGQRQRDVSNKYLGLSENWATPNHEKSWKIPIKKIAIWATCSVGRRIIGLKTYEGSLSKSNMEPQPGCLRMINSRWLMMHHGGWWIKNASWWIMYDGNFGKYLRSHSSLLYRRWTYLANSFVANSHMTGKSMVSGEDLPNKTNPLRPSEWMTWPQWCRCGSSPCCETPARTLNRFMFPWRWNLCLWLQTH